MRQEAWTGDEMRDLWVARGNGALSGQGRKRNVISRISTCDWLLTVNLVP